MLRFLAFPLAAAAIASPARSFLSLEALKGSPNGERLCKLGDVEILRAAGEDGDRRTMVFANSEHLAVEAVVECGESAGSCAAASCAPCPCSAKMDGPDRLGTATNRVINTRLEKLCGKPSRVLLIGLGGSVLTQYLAANCPEMKLDNFEISEDVVAVAQNFFGLRETQERNPGRVAVSTVDAAEGLADLTNGGAGLELADGFDPSGTDAYDAVVIDCFVGQGKIPDGCRSQQSLELVKTVLRPGGELLQNTWARSPDLPEVQEDFAVLTAGYQSVFSKFESLKVPEPPEVDFVNILVGTK